MIKTFAHTATRDIYDDVNSKAARTIPQRLWGVIRRKLDWLESATNLHNIGALPGNRLEALKGDMKGWYSIRVNDQYRIIFRFEDGSAFDVEVVDYH